MNRERAAIYGTSIALDDVSLEGQWCARVTPDAAIVVGQHSIGSVPRFYDNDEQRREHDGVEELVTHPAYPLSVTFTNLLSWQAPCERPRQQRSDTMKRQATLFGSQRLKAPACIKDRTARKLGSALFGHLCCGRSRITLDMSSVNAVDATGIDMLIQTSKRAHSMGGYLLLVRASPPVRNIAVLEGLTRRRQSRYHEKPTAAYGYSVRSF